MSTRRVLGAPAAAQAAHFRSGPHARRPNLAASSTLERLSDRLDALIRDAGSSRPSQLDWERQAEEAEEIAKGLRAAFRGAGEAVHPPLWQRPGKAMW